jgi:glycerol-1-phosphatase
MTNQRQIGTVGTNRRLSSMLKFTNRPADISEIEGRIPRLFGNDAVAIEGSKKLLAAMEERNVPWAVVTSGTRALVDGWVNVLKLAHPKTLVVAEDVENGKPDPECYLLGRKRLGLGLDAQMVVFEDAPSGIRAGKAAGFKVIGLATTHSIARVKDAGADWIVKDLRSVSIKNFEKGVVQIQIDNALVDNP